MSLEIETRECLEVCRTANLVYAMVNDKEILLQRANLWLSSELHMCYKMCPPYIYHTRERGTKGGKKRRQTDRQTDRD